MVFETCKGRLALRADGRVRNGVMLYRPGFPASPREPGSRGHPACSPCFAQYQRRDMILVIIFAFPGLGGGDSTQESLTSLLHRPRLPALPLCSTPQGQPSCVLTLYRDYFSPSFFLDKQDLKPPAVTEGWERSIQAPEDNNKWSVEHIQEIDGWGINIIIQIQISWATLC